MRSNNHILFLLLTLLLSEYVFVQKPIITVQPTDQPTCEGKKVTFSVTSNAASFQWMESKDGVNFTPLTEGYLYSGSNTKDLTIKGVNSLYKNYTYKCIL